MIVVYDLETYKSCFTYTDINIQTEKITQFIIHKDKDQTLDLIDYLEKVKGGIGFNNLNFDYPIIHYLFQLYPKLIANAEKSFLYDEDGKQITKLLFDKAQEIIHEQELDYKDRTNYIKDKDYKIQQLDLYKIWHYDNAARSTSLKALEISMNYPNVMESTIPFDKEDISLSEVKEILEYNLNDVLATYEFYKRSKDKISLRKSLREQYNINCMNWSDSKIGEQLILKLYCDETNSNPYEVKKQRTYHKSIKLGNCLLPYISFKTQGFTDLLNKFKSSVITETKNSIDEFVIFKGLKYIYGTGGIHACIESGVYKSDDNYLIIDADVGSLYPSLAIQNNLFIRHLGPSFTKVYKSIVDKRIEAKKAGNTIISDALKLSANSAYGKSNDINSFLYDPEFTMKITLNGQLLLTMLIERIILECQDIQVLQINTDGFTVKIHKSHIDTYYNICSKWEKLTKLNLEYVNYNKMVIGDVNNYSAISDKSKIKNKGRFEFDKVVGGEVAYHKDNSFKIVPLAINNYFFNNIPVEDTIRESRNIYDFCGRQKFKGKDRGITNTLEYDTFNNPYNKKEIQQKNVRYYISTNGSTFVKKFSESKTIETDKPAKKKKTDLQFIHKDWKITIFNKFVEKDWKDYNIDYQFYIQECYKEINQIEKKQLTLF